MEGVMPDQPGVAVFMFLAASAIALFSFLAVNSWADARRKERESYYRNDMLKKLSEAQGPGANATLELLREESRVGAVKKRQELRIGGLITAAVGLGVLIFLRALIRDEPVYLCGSIPLLIGVALYASSYVVATVME
jgi:hypothetical protein